jgi:pantoate--beta-alanine ligase
MELIHSVAELRARLKREESIGFVPTMGNLHQGHIDLTRVAGRKVDCTVVSIFVNRLQFGPREDFGKYPRTLPEDCEKCAAAGVDIVFAPDESEMYPEPQGFMVEPNDLQNILEGAFRPGHFRGVATVVLKLFNMVQPTVAVFGKKDYQQCKVLTTMVRQLALPVEMELVETTRAEDGLALSSRNGYLSAAERLEAPRLYRLLNEIKQQIQNGAPDFTQLEKTAIESLSAHSWQPDYITIRRQTDLASPQDADRQLVILAAAKLGLTRLIDNLEVAY